MIGDKDKQSLEYERVYPIQRKVQFRKPTQFGCHICLLIIKDEYQDAIEIFGYMTLYLIEYYLTTISLSLGM